MTTDGLCEVTKIILKVRDFMNHNSKLQNSKIALSYTPVQCALLLNDNGSQQYA